ncbi:outer membrane protein [Ancylobacter sp.]|uniref:outer membrane protein n=1 Tax=Ancylobacter sp. TaxID=1872567 RepID=UPI003D111EBD
MNRSLLLGAAALIISGSASLAADMPYPVKAQATQVFVPAFSWTGFYLGGNAGYSWGDSKATDVLFFDSTGGVFTPGGLYSGNDVKFGELDGWVAGGQIGYNYQFENNVVVGVEADFQWTGAEQGLAFYATPGGPYYQTKAELEWFGTVRARLGYAFDRLLVYGTGGFAYGKVNNSTTVMGLTGGGAPDFSTAANGSFDNVSTGWTVGGGLEYALTDNWILRGEYLYVDLGSTDVTTYLSGTPGSFISSKADLTSNIVRAAVSYKF